MKTIEIHQAVVTGVSSKVDGSLSLRLATPELSVEEKVAVMELQNLIIVLKMTPSDVSSEEMSIHTEKGVKTPGQRLRAVIWIYHKQYGKGEDFEVFYRKHMDKMIENYKTRLD